MKKSMFACCGLATPLACFAHGSAYAASIVFFLAAAPIPLSAQVLPGADGLNDAVTNAYQTGILLEPSPFARRTLFNAEIQKHYGNMLAVVAMSANASRFYDSQNLRNKPQTVYFTFAAAYALDKQLSLAAKASYGKSTNLGLADGLTTRNDTLNTVAYGLALNANRIWHGKDRIGLSLSVPTKVISGDMKLSNPLSTSPQAHVDEVPFGDAARTLNLRPSATERNWELSYSNTVGKNATLVFGLRLRLNPGHDASAPSSRGIGVRFSQDF